MATSSWDQDSIISFGDIISTKTLSIISAVLTIISLILIGIFLFVMTLVALNGYGDSEGTAAVVITLACQGVGLILSGILAGWRPVSSSRNSTGIKF